MTIVFESENANINPPKINYIIVEIRKTKIDENGHIYEVVREEKIPDFLADILINNDNIFMDSE